MSLAHLFSQRFLIVCFILLSLNIQAQEYELKPRRIYSKQDRLRGELTIFRTCFDVHYYHLDLKINPKKQSIEGSNEIHFQVTSPTKKIQIDLFSNLKIDKIIWKDKELKYSHKNNAVFIDFPIDSEKNSLENINVCYHGKPKTSYELMMANKGFFWSKDDKGRNWVAVSCEHLGASMWWPNKDHLSDEPDSTRISLTTPKELECISNGRLESIEKVDDEHSRHNWFVNNPINNYNVSFYLGHYVAKAFKYENSSGEHDIFIYALDYDEPFMVNYYAIVPTALKFYESLFGEYAFWNDKYAILQSPNPGMEHQSCLAIGPEIRTYNNWYYTAGTIWHSTLVHEMAHEWWGNSVSVSDMADAWIHEGFATYCEMLLIEELYGYDEYLKNIKWIKSSVLGYYPIVGNTGVNEDTFLGGDIYFRGAYVLHELREELGKQIFLGILMGFQHRYRKSNVTTQDFIDFVNEMTKKDYTTFLKDRLYKK